MASRETVSAGESKDTKPIPSTSQSVARLRGPELYKSLTSAILTENTLRNNGFPRPHPNGESGRAKIFVVNTLNHFPLTETPNERICNRCHKRYAIDDEGFALRPERCYYHTGKKYRTETEYSCCRRRVGLEPGCETADTHVWEYIDYDNLHGFVKTLPKDIPPEEQGIFALDCEMSYTTRGLRVISVTLVNEDCRVIYQTLVKPQYPIIDYNTRYSGVTEEIMRNVTTTLEDVQAKLLSIISSKTILVGHGLDNDLRCLQILHDTVLDTSILFPHRYEFPNKRSLKSICAQILKKCIQKDVKGHDAAEDAIACMELIFWISKTRNEAEPW